MDPSNEKYSVFGCVGGAFLQHFNFWMLIPDFCTVSMLCHILHVFIVFLTCAVSTLHANLHQCVLPWWWKLHWLEICCHVKWGLSSTWSGTGEDEDILEYLDWQLRSACDWKAKALPTKSQWCPQLSTDVLKIEHAISWLVQAFKIGAVFWFIYCHLLETTFGNVLHFYGVHVASVDGLFFFF